MIVSGLMCTPSVVSTMLVPPRAIIPYLTFSSSVMLAKARNGRQIRLSKSQTRLPLVHADSNKACYEDSIDYFGA